MAKAVDATRGPSSGPSAPAGPARRCSTAIRVDYYGAITPLKQLATVSAPEARLLTVQPYDKSSIKQIEKAILESDDRPHAEQRRQHRPPRRSPS